MTVVRFPQNANGDRTHATIKLYNETHTIGNSLRYVLARNPDADFVGYSVPHPGEPYLNVRLQTRGQPVEVILKKGLNDLSDMCDNMLESFEAELAKCKMLDTK